MSQRSDGPDWIAIYLVGLLLVAFLVVIAAAGNDDQGAEQDVEGNGWFAWTPPTASPPVTPSPEGPGTSPTPAVGGAGEEAPAAPAAEVSALPGGGTRIFAGNRMLVAYYGTAGTGALGVLGEASPDRIMPRLVRAARPFARNGRKVQPVFELIVTVAHGGPTKTGMYSSDIDHALVRRYVEAAHRLGVLLVLDLQPGRASFLAVAKRWEWALKDPWVGLALDPEWRMGRRGVPGRRIGSVSAAEVNQVARWLGDLTARERLPQKVFMLHQFRADMIPEIGSIVPRPNLAMIQHVDGFGTPEQKLATFRHVIRPRQFALGFKLFYDEDVRRLNALQVLRIRPRIRFVSFQ